MGQERITPARIPLQVLEQGGADGHGFKARKLEQHRRTRQYVEQPGKAQYSSRRIKGQ